MASLNFDADKKTAFIQWRDVKKARRGIRLAGVNKSFATRFHSLVETLSDAQRTGSGLDRHTTDFVSGLSDEFYDKLAKTDLIEPRVKAPSEDDSTDDEGGMTLGRFLAEYLERRTDVKAGTKTFYGHTRRNLLDCIGEKKLLAEITEGDADEFRRYLKRKKLSDATINRRCGLAKTFFRAAVRHRLIAANPFQDLAATTKINAERQRFIDRETISAVIDAAPDAEWRLLIALSRYGGLRVPSEPLSLKWSDIDWEKSRLKVTSPKTEHHQGRSFRWVPIFPELKPHLEAVWEQAEDGAEWVISKHRPAATQDSWGHWRAINLRTQFEKIIRRAGVDPWPKLWQNLRSSRETELCEQHPLHVVCQWIGNTERIAAKHYLQVRDEDFEKAITSQVVMPKVMPLDAVLGCTDSHDAKSLMTQVVTVQEKTAACENMQPSELGNTGFEPVTSTV